MLIEKLGEVAISGQPTNFEIFSQAANKYFDIDMFSPEKGKIVSIFRDITERKRAEEELSKNVATLVKSQEIAHLGSWSINFDTGKFEASDEDYRIYGLEPGTEAIMDMIWTMIHPDDLERYREYVESVQQEGRLGSIDYRIVHPDDSVHYLHVVTYSIIRAHDGKVKIASGITQDITERKKAEEMLQTTMQRLHIILSNMHGAILLVSERGRIEFVNDNFCQYFNLNEQPADLVGITASEMIKKISRSYSDPNWAVVRINEIVERGELVIGEEIVMTGGRTCIRDFIPLFIGGKLYGRLWYHIDITERKKAEKALKKAHDTLEEKVKERTAELEKAYESLKESEGSLAEAQKMAHIGNWKWDIRTNEMYCSDEVYRIFGLKPQLGITFDAYFNYIHPDDRDLIIDSVKEILKGKPYSIDNRIITANREERIIHSNAEIIFDENNIPVYAKGIVQDVTESRQAEKALQENEARFRNLFETMPSGVVIYDVIDEGRDFIFKDINPAGERIDQVRKENIIGKSLYELFPNVSEMRLDEVFRRVWLTGKPEFFPVTLYKDERIALWVTNHIYRLPSGELVAVFDDITERKKAEESLARIEIARKQEIHHRIKNNLQVISSLLDLQAEQFRNRECIKDSEVLEAFRESQHRVISMALIHEELYKGGEFETLNLAPYIKELTQNLFQTYSLGNSDIRLNIDLAENTFFDMDIAVPLGMIVNELVSNSLKYAFIGRDKGEIRIRLVREESLQLKNQDCESTIFILTVSDNGVGIAENIKIKNLDTLGMQLVTSLVNQLDGEFGLKRDNGTEFIIRFTVKER